MIRASRSAAVTTITIDRPERRNALSAEMCVDLRAAVLAAADDDGRAIVLAGSGGHFCAGADLSGVEGGEFRTALRALLDAMLESPLPLIAAVEGAALGAGTQLAVACDLRMATPDARFGIPAARLGLMVDHWTVQRLALLAGHGPARAMLLAADEVSGQDAHRLGLVQRLGTLADAQQWAEHIADLAPLTVSGHKLAINRVEAELDDAAVAEAVARAWASADVAEGQAAFRERRPPRFEGR